MCEEIRVPLKHPRGSIKEAKVQYQESIDCEGHAFKAWIYMGTGKAIYAEMQGVITGTRLIRSFFEYGDNPDVGPRYMDNGLITHREEIKNIDGWIAWLIEYVSGLDPRDHFKFYKKAVGGF